MKFSLVSSMLAIIFFSPDFGHSAVHYVHPDSALNTIQGGLNLCSQHDTVLVAPGNYRENISWPPTQGIDLMSEYGPESTAINGDGDSTVIDIFCCVGFRNTVIEGFTLENGATTWSGGGIRTLKSDVVIRNNHIVNNSAPWRGAGLYLELSSVEITGNVIEQNTALIGAGLHITGYGVIIRDNIIRNNTADSLGGGIHANHENITIRDNLVTQNSAQYGGGIFMDSPSYWATSLIVSNTISENTASVIGGGLYSQDIGNAHLSMYLNNIENNQNYGVFNEDTITIDAEYNWWGDATGPYHPVLNPGGLGDTVSDYIDFIPWAQSPVGITEEPEVVLPIEQTKLPATILCGPLNLPTDKKYKIFDITGRAVTSHNLRPGIYFVAIEDKIVQKVIKVR